MTQTKDSIGGTASPNHVSWPLNTIAQANDVVIDHYPIVPILVRSRCCQQSHASLAAVREEADCVYPYEDAVDWADKEVCITQASDTTRSVRYPNS